MPHLHATQASVLSPAAEFSAFVSQVLVCCLDIRAVWRTRHGAHDDAPALEHEFLAFADKPTLDRLRQCGDLHRSDVELLVVIDGDRFENAWGPRKLSGSLARWAWRQVSAELAYYDESIWAERNAGAGSVTRVRRKAVLVWEKQPARSVDRLRQ